MSLDIELHDFQEPDLDEDDIIDDEESLIERETIMREKSAYKKLTTGMLIVIFLIGLIGHLLQLLQ